MELTEFQETLQYSLWKIFETRIVHKIFDNAIYDISLIILKDIILHEPEESDGNIIYSGWNYDSVNQTVINSRNQSLYHPIYIQFENVEGIARGWVDIRETARKSKEELRHDPIIIHINRAIVKKSDFIYHYGHQIFDLNGTVPGLLAHEFTHVRDMWCKEYENISYTLRDMSHSAFREDLRIIREKTHHLYINEDIANIIELMFGLMSKFETEARLEALDKAIKVVPSHKIAEMIFKYSDDSDKSIEFINNFDMIFGTGIKMLKMADDWLQEKVNRENKDNLFFHFIFMCFAVHYEFIDDSKNIINSAEDIKILYDPSFELTRHINKLIKEATIEYHKRFKSYLSKILYIIKDEIKNRRKSSPVEFKLFESIPIEKEPSLKCFYYPDNIIEVIYQSIYGDNMFEKEPIKMAFELSNELRRPIFNDEMLIKKAINEGLTEKPLIWVSRSINI